MLRPALGSVAVQNMHVVIAEIGQRGGGLLGQLADALDRVDVAGDLGEDGRRIARSGSDLEHLFAALERQGFGHECDDIGLGDRLLFVDRQRAIVVGKLAQLFRQERLARHAAHGVENQFGAHAARKDGLFDHLVAQASKISFEMRKSWS